MSNELRREVLSSLKKLHRTRQMVFKGDTRALAVGRDRINEEFKKQKHVQNAESIRELINQANAVEHELRTGVVQAREVEPGKFQAVITADTVRLDNVPFKDECCGNVASESGGGGGGGSRTKKCT